MIARHVVAALFAILATAASAVGSGADALKEIAQYRSTLFTQAQEKAKPDGKAIDLQAVQLLVKAKAEEISKGIDPAKVPASEALDWAQVFNLAGHPRDTVTVLNAFVETKPDAKPLFEANAMLIAAMWLVKDDKGLIATLKSLKPYSPASSLEYASLAATYVPHEFDQLGADDSAMVLDLAISTVETGSLDEKQRRHFAAIQRFAVDFKIDLFKDTGKRDKALQVIDDALKNASDSMKAHLVIQRNQITLVGLAATELKADNVIGKFSSLGALKGKVVLVVFLASWCDPCKAAFPGISQAFSDLNSKGLEVIGVTHPYGYVTDSSKTLAPDEEVAAMGTFLKDQKVEWPVIFGPTENFTNFGVTAMPCFVIIGRDGVVRSLRIGYSPLAWADIRKELGALIAEPGS